MSLVALQVNLLLNDPLSQELARSQLQDVEEEEEEEQREEMKIWI